MRTLFYVIIHYRVGMVLIKVLSIFTGTFTYLLPSWFLGKFPEKKIIQTAHTAELATGFGRKVRNLVSSENYQKVFDTKLSSDSKAAGRWNTNMGGDYFAIGVGGAVTGKGADLLIIDDPHSEQEAKQGNPAVRSSLLSTNLVRLTLDERVQSSFGSFVRLEMKS